MERILYVVGGRFSRGGIESFIMNYYRHMNRSKIQIDFIVHGYGKGAYDDEIESLGGRIYHVPIKTKNPIKNVRMLYGICKSGRYQIIHAHMDAMSYVPLKIAKKCGIAVRIAHSHNTEHLTNNRIKIILNEYARKKLPLVVTHYYACSKMAGIWLFGEKNVDKIQIVSNAIDIDRFRYDKHMRKTVRDRMGIDDSDIIIGHVGRYEYQKNHEYLIEVFNRLHKVSDRYKLMLIGDGSLKEAVKEKVRNDSLSDFVIFVDACGNVNEYYNAFDLFCMPSYFEGLSVVMIEAQCNGLQCITSDTTSVESNVTGNVQFLPISQEAIDVWVNKILGADLSRDSDAVQKIIGGGYSICDAAVKLQEKYLQLIKNTNSGLH